MNSELSLIQVDDLSIAYRRAGTGPALVALHGFLCDSRCWRHQLANLSDKFTVIAWDAPGAGSSSDPPESFALTDWTHCLSKFLERLGVETACILGLSWGGVLAQDFCRLYSERLSGLILADTYAGWKGSFPASIVEQRLSRCDRDSFLAANEFVLKWVPEMFTESASPDLLREMSEIFADFHPLGFRVMARSLADTDTTDFLPTIAARTLLLWGGDDRRSPLPIAEQLRQLIPKAELQVIPNAGHVSNMERPDEFNSRVRGFCLAAGPLR